ncbi:hypothetical protein HDV05_008363 [Chytridiales sp. JEL 0842]|nr:hypothetical protein HDV05_008363 [Chytridiales sp. JEL 0842]
MPKPNVTRNDDGYYYVSTDDGPVLSDKKGNVLKDKVNIYGKLVTIQEQADKLKNADLNRMAHREQHGAAPKGTLQLEKGPKTEESTKAVAESAVHLQKVMNNDGQRPMGVTGGALIRALEEQQKEQTGKQPNRKTNDLDVHVQMREGETAAQMVERLNAASKGVTKQNGQGKVTTTFQISEYSKNHPDADPSLTATMRFKPDDSKQTVEVGLDVHLVKPDNPELQNTQKMKLNGQDVSFIPTEVAASAKLKATAKPSRVDRKGNVDIHDMEVLSNSLPNGKLSPASFDASYKEVRDNLGQDYTAKENNFKPDHYNKVGQYLEKVAPDGPRKEAVTEALSKVQRDEHGNFTAKDFHNALPEPAELKRRVEEHNKLTETQQQKQETSRRIVPSDSPGLSNPTHPTPPSTPSLDTTLRRSQANSQIDSADLTNPETARVINRDTAHRQAANVLNRNSALTTTSFNDVRESKEPTDLQQTLGASSKNPLVTPQSKEALEKQKETTGGIHSDFSNVNTGGVGSNRVGAPVRNEADGNSVKPQSAKGYVDSDGPDVKPQRRGKTK